MIPLSSQDTAAGVPSTAAGAAHTRGPAGTPAAPRAAPAPHSPGTLPTRCDPLERSPVTQLGKRWTCAVPGHAECVPRHRAVQRRDRRQRARNGDTAAGKRGPAGLRQAERGPAEGKGGETRPEHRLPTASPEEGEAGRR